MMERTKKPRVVVDIDGVLATGTTEEVYSAEAGWAYDKCQLIPEGKRMCEVLHDEGTYIILHTSRWESDRQITEDWLAKHGVPYDELRLGKPSALMYIDDRNWPMRFWPSIDGNEQGLEAMVKTLKHRAATDPGKWKR